MRQAWTVLAAVLALTAHTISLAQSIEPHDDPASQPDSVQLLTASNISELLEALAQAHTVGAHNNVTTWVYLAPGTYSLTTPLDIAARIVFVGNQTTVTCAGTHARAINVWAVGHVSFSGITFIGCSESAIYMSVPLGGGPDGAEDDGLPHDVRVDNCTFLAYGSGTAIFATGSRLTLTITNTLFQSTLAGTLPILDEDHSASIVQGGALVAAGVGALTVTQCTFTANARGILAVAVPVLVVNDTMLVGNRAVGQGGAMAVYHTNVSFAMYNTTFLNNLVIPGHPNSASLLFNTTQDPMAMGGALHVEAPAATDGVYFLGCNFTGNQASSSDLAEGSPDSPGTSGLGGAMYVRASSFFIQRSQVMGNTAWGPNGMAGGARVSTGSGIIKVYGTTFGSNAAGHRGGGLYLSSSGTVDMQNCNFLANRAGPQLSDDDVRTALDPAQFGGQSVISWGGGLLAEGVEEEGGGELLSVIRTTFDSNVATFWGGALLARSYGVQTISGSTFIGNQAGAVGGALYLNGGAALGVTVAHCAFQGNSAGVWGAIPSDSIYGLGGAIASLNPTTRSLTVDTCTFDANVAGYAGGAVRIESTTAFITGTSFQGNRATMTAGALSIDASTDLTLSRSSFTGNSAGSPVGVLQGALYEGRSYGGALHAYASTLLLTDGVTFTGNQASLGGAVAAQRMYRYNISTNVAGTEPVVFVGNLAAVGGAMFVSDFSDTLLTGPNLVVANNTAATGGGLALLGSYFQLHQVTLAGNSALLDPSSLTGVQRAWADNLGCGVGGGGALCVSQLQPQLTSEIVNSRLTGNRAVSGGAVYHEGLGNCDPGNNCFRLIVYNSTLTGNSAAGGGGAGIYWQHLNVTTIVCSSSAAQNLTDLLVEGETYAKGNWAIGLGTRLDPCPEWQGNQVLEGSYGERVASSPFSLSAPSFLPFYSSNADMAVSVNVLDYYGQTASGMGTSENEVVVRAELGPNDDTVGMSGETQRSSHNGTSTFSTLRLRARSGLHTLRFTAATALRTLAPARLLVNVRPCNVSEFLAPVTLDQCLPCDAGTFNTDPTATACQTCPGDAECGAAVAPEDIASSIFNTTGGPTPSNAAAAAAMTLSSSLRGIIVPADGFWHTNPFSEAVQECPNKQACVFPGRTQMIGALQAALLAGAGVELARSAATATQSMPEGQLQQLLFNPDAVLRQLAAGPEGNQAWMALLADHDMAAVLALHRELAAGGNDTLPLAVELYGDALCAEGYMGNMCGACMPGWGSTDSGKCKRCPPWSANTAFYALMSLLTLIGLAMTLRVSMRRMALAKRFRNADGSDFPTPSQQSHNSLVQHRISNTSVSTIPYQLHAPSSPPRGHYPQLHVHTGVSAQPVIWESGSETVTPSAHAAAAGTGAEYALRISGTFNEGYPTVGARASLSAVPQYNSGLPPLPPMAPLPPPPAPPLQQPQPHSASIAACVAAGLNAPPLGPFATAMRQSQSGGGFSGPAIGSGMSGGYPQAASGMLLPPPPDYSSPLHTGVVAAGGPAVEAQTQAMDMQAAGAGLTPTNQQLRRRSRANTSVAGSSSAGYGSMGGSSAGGAAAGPVPLVPARVSGDGRGTPPAPRHGLFASVADAAAGILGMGAARSSRSAAGQGPHATSDGGGGMAALQQVQVQVGGCVEDRDSAEREGGHAQGRSVRPAVCQQGDAGKHAGGKALTLDMGGSADGSSYPAIQAQGMESENAAGAGGQGRPSLTVSQPDSALNDPTTLKILVSYIQVLAMVRSVPLAFPHSFSAYMRVYNTITSVPGTSVSIDCSLPDYGPHMSKAIIKVIVAVTAPIYCSIAMCCMWVGMFHGQRWWARRKGLDNRVEMGSFTQYMKNRMIVTWFTAVFFFYPSVVSNLLSIFSCTDVDTAPNNALAVAAGLARGRYWDADLQQRCYQGPHLALAMALGVPGLLLFALGVPLCSALFLRVCRPHHEKPHFLALYSFLYEEYRDAFYMWESVIMLRKLGVACLVVFLSNQDIGVQLLVVMAVIMAALALQTMLEPYDAPSMNALEKLSLWTTLATLYLSLFLVYSALSDTARMAISALLILINAFTMFIFAYFIVTEYYNDMKRKLGVHTIPGDLPPEQHRREVQRVLTEKYGRVLAPVLAPVVTTANVVERKVWVVKETGSRSLQRMTSRFSGGSRRRISFVQATGGGVEALAGREGSINSRTSGQPPYYRTSVTGSGLRRTSASGGGQRQSFTGASSGQLPSPTSQQQQPPPPARPGRMDAWVPPANADRLW